MSIISKTAKASMTAGQVGPKDAVVFTDAERLRLLRLETASNIYPSNENTRALLRVYDAALADAAKLRDQLDTATEALARLVVDNAVKDATIQNLEETIVHRNDELAALQPTQAGPPTRRTPETNN